MKLVNISKAAEILSVTKTTLRYYDKEGTLKPVTRTPGGHRRYSIQQLHEFLGIDNDKNNQKDNNETRVYIYARVSTKKQKATGNLDRQKTRLMEHCINQGYKIVKVYQEVASGINENRRQLHKMLDNLEEVNKIIIEYKDRLARFGFKYLEKIAKAYNVEIEIIEDKETKTIDEEMVEDLISIITSFSARIYGARGGKKVKETLNQLAKEGVSNENNN